MGRPDLFHEWEKSGFSVETEEGMDVADSPTMPLNVQRNPRRSKKRLVALAVLAVLLLVTSGSAVVVGILADTTYHRDLSLANAEVQHLRSAFTLLESLQKQPFASQTVEQAQQEFVSALGDGQSLSKSLASFSGVASILPVYGQRVISANRLAALAVTVSQTGISGCKLLTMLLAHLGSPLNTSGPGLTQADFTAIVNEYQIVKVQLNSAMNEALLLTPGDVSFDARLAKLLPEFQADIPTIRTALSEVDQILPALPSLLGIGAPANYLLEIMDSTELRPGGGFIGNYGIATLSGGRITATHITDTYLLDTPFERAGGSIPFPAAYDWFASYLGLTSWSLRDSNLDANFPTDARNGEQNYHLEGGTAALQGVIAITPFFIEDVLNITGPISVPEYNQTVTAKNLIDLIHYYQLGVSGSDTLLSPNGQTSQRKYFTELLGQYLLARLQHLAPAALAKCFQLAITSLRTKDVQVYFNASSAEKALGMLNLDGSILAPPEDHLFVVDASVGGSKANGSIVSTEQDQVTIDQQGGVVHHTTLTYTWKPGGETYGSLYKDYVRIYAPSGSKLAQQGGWQPQGSAVAFGSQVWMGFFTLVSGQTRTITLTWTSAQMARHSAGGWQYQYLLQRQAGARWTVNVQVSLPACAQVTGKQGGFASTKQAEVHLAQSLTQDMNLEVEYVCK